MRPQYTPDAASCQVVEQHGRLLVRFTARRPDVWRDLHDSFKAHFPRHSDACYSPATRTWSVAPHRRRQLEEWLARTFHHTAIIPLRGETADEKGQIA